MASLEHLKGENRSSAEEFPNSFGAVFCMMKRKKLLFAKTSALKCV
jgi:hypothetical protein